MKIFGLAGWSGSGKTTLIVKLIPLIIGKGLTVSTIKHAHHAFDIDRPGKDSFEHRQSGAKEVLISSANRWALMHENNYHDELSLVDLLGKLDNLKYDLILIEGFKTEPFPKIELYREEINKNRGLLSESDENIVAIATESATKLNTNLTVLDINKPQDIVNFIINFLDIYK